MMNTAKCLLFAAMLGLFTAPGALALRFAPPPPPPPPQPQPKPHTAPEIDGAMAASGLALLGGSLVVVRARRKK